MTGYTNDYKLMVMLLLFGLGNPGREYEHTYHNVGLLAVLALYGQLAEPDAHTAPKTEKHFWHRKYPGLVLAGTAPDAGLFMNESGRVVEEALAYFKLIPKQLILTHDDSDLPLGTWKLEAERGDAGHHGVESTIQTLGTNTFLRGRIGIRPREIEGIRRKAGEFVLKTISKEDAALLEGVFKELGEKILSLARREA